MTAPYCTICPDWQFSLHYSIIKIEILKLLLSQMTFPLGKWKYQAVGLYWVKTCWNLPLQKVFLVVLSVWLCHHVDHLRSLLTGETSLSSFVYGPANRSLFLILLTGNKYIWEESFILWSKYKVHSNSIPKITWL